MTTVTAEQIAAQAKAKRDRHEALAKALRDAWKSGDKSWLDLAAIALSDHFADAGKMVTALQERVEGLEGELRSTGEALRDEVTDRLDAEARADALSAELEGLKKNIDGRQTINQPQCGTASATAEVCDQKRSTEFLALNGCKAASPILQQLIQRQYNVETWGLIGRLKAVEAAIKSSEVQSISPNVVSAGNSGLDTINTSQNHPSTNGEG